MMSIPRAFELAWEHYRAGRLAQAEQLCRRIVQAYNGHAGALHLLGLIAERTGRQDSAIEYFHRAIRLDPDLADAHNNLGILLASRRRLDEAVASFRQALRARPDHAAAHNNLGNALRERGELEAATASFREALRIDPDYAVAHFGLGLALQVQGRLDEAAASFRRAVQLRPVHAEAHCHLGFALLHRPRPDVAAAIVDLEQAIRLRPDYPEAHHSLGTALMIQGRPEEAAARFREAVRLRPDYASAHLDLGNALRKQGKLTEAVLSYRLALHRAPDQVEAYNNLGNALLELGQPEAAEAILRQAVRLRPDHAEAAYNLGIALWKRGKPEEAAASYRHAIALDPDHAEAHLNLGNCLKDQGLLDEAIASYRAAIALRPDAASFHSNLIMALLYHPGHDQRSIGEEARRWSRRHAEPLGREIRPHANHPDPERRLRIGYVSPEFREHVDSFFTVPLLSHHDHRSFEIFCYARMTRPDAVTARIRGHADVWRDTAGLTDREAADLIRGDRIDILVDLKLHTAKGELLVFARRPAPVQVSWLGYPGTTGLSAIDYHLTDPYLDPPGLFDACHSEEPLRLPDTFWCYDPLTVEPAVGTLPALESGAITFGCLNNFCKVSDASLTLWAEVLRAVPRSRLLLRAPQGRARDHVLATLGREGIAAARVEFADMVPRQEYLRLYHRIDLGLDPLPYNGHTTSLDAFWMGVPTLTLVGRTVVGRAGWSQLCNLGLRELAAEAPDRFVTLAARLAGDLPRLRELRGGLRERMSRSPLMDAPRFARNVEQAYRQIWRRWCAGRPPGPPPSPDAGHGEGG